MSFPAPPPQTQQDLTWLIILLGTLLGVAILAIAILLSVCITMAVFGRRRRDEQETSQGQNVSSTQQSKVESIQSTDPPSHPSQSSAGVIIGAQLPRPQNRVWRAGSRWLPAYIPRHPDLMHVAYNPMSPVLRV